MRKDKRQRRDQKLTQGASPWVGVQAPSRSQHIIFAVAYFSSLRTHSRGQIMESPTAVMRIDATRKGTALK